MNSQLIYAIICVVFYYYDLIRIKDFSCRDLVLLELFIERSICEMNCLIP